MRRIVLYLITLHALAGCAAPPVAPDNLSDPALRHIHTAFVRTVEAAHRDPQTQWHSGWVGNMRINLAGTRQRGLCYHWQALVYRGVLATVRREGWHATGIMINFGTRNEHHAVLVFDPKEVQQSSLLASPQGKPAWVLDAWRRGRADIYRLDDWLKLPLVVHKPAKLTKVEPARQLGDIPE